MPENPEQLEPLRLLRRLRAVGPNALTLDQKIGLVRAVRERSPEAGASLDESMLAELEHLRAGLETAHRKQCDLKAMLDVLTAPPWHFGVYLGSGSGSGRDSAALVGVAGGRRLLNIAPGVDAATFGVGDAVFLGSEQNVVVGKAPMPVLTSGETATFDRFVDEQRIVIRARDEEFVVEAAQSLRTAGLRAGDTVRWDRVLCMAFEKVERSQGRHLFLDDTPAETFASIGGLDTQIAELQRTIRMHYAHAATVNKYGLRRRSAVLLAGPPGTGKTLIARALANWLAQLSPAGRSRFMNVKPGSLHSMWYAQSEANYREAFRVAREAGEDHPDVPVVMFFDEVDSIGGARGDLLSRVDDRVLTAFLAELDGLESRGNVLVVCATNRRDALDPALLRAGGRLGDIVLDVPRPNRRAGRDIFARHLPPGIPYRSAANGGGGQSSRDELIDAAVSRIYDPNGLGELCTLTFRDGKARAVVPADLVSGAAIANIAQRAIERACQREVETGEAGVALGDLLDAVDSEFETGARALTPASCRRHIEGLPQDVDVVRIQRAVTTSRRVHRYLRLA